MRSLIKAFDQKFILNAKTFFKEFYNLKERHKYSVSRNTWFLYFSTLLRSKPTLFNQYNVAWIFFVENVAFFFIVLSLWGKLLSEIFFFWTITVGAIVVNTFMTLPQQHGQNFTSIQHFFYKMTSVYEEL